MQYELAGWDGTKRVSLPIDKADFERTQDAKERLIDVLRIEEKYNMLLENYEEFEKALLGATLNHVLFSEPVWASLVSMGYQTARRLQNVLSMARLYIDQVCHDLRVMYGSDAANLATFEEWTHQEYESRLGYRTMEALRNFMQHRSLPVQGMSIGGERRELASGSFNVYTIRPTIDIVEIREEGGFKPSVLAELEAIGHEVPLKQLLREYIEGLANVHHRLRVMLAGDVPKWKALLDEATARFAAAFPANPQHVSVVARHLDGTTDTHDIFRDFIDRLHWLQAKNSKGLNLKRQLISSE
jgi:uncharacterized damage-inducible protein DinB